MSCGSDADNALRFRMKGHGVIQYTCGEVGYYCLADECVYSNGVCTVSLHSQKYSFKSPRGICV